MIMLTVVFVILIIGIIAIFKRKRQNRQLLMSLFQQYNQAQEIQVITDWVRAKKTEQRLTSILEFLKEIEHEDLAVKILKTLNLDHLHKRHLLIFAAQALLASGDPQAITVGERLMKKHPKDDSILDTYVHIHLSIGSFEEAKRVLIPRLKRKYKGTIFTRHYARILAEEGDLARAIEIMQTVVKRDFTLFQNTFATPQKSLIRKQFEESQAFLNDFRQRQDPETTADLTS